jgi:hypothetical protein
LEIADPEVRPLVDQQGRDQFRYRLQSGTQKPCFSTAGLIRYSWPPAEVIRHLLARLWRRIVSDGLINPESITEDQQQMIDAQAATFLGGLARDFEPLVPSVRSMPIGSGTPPDETVRKHWEGVRTKLDKDLRAFEGYVRKELVRFLADPPGYLAGADRFLTCLESRGLFEGILCRTATIAAVAEFFGKRAAELPAMVAGEDFESKAEGQIARLRRVLEQLARAATTMSDGQAAYVRFLWQVFCLVTEDLSRGGPANIIWAVLEIYNSEAGGLRDQLKEAMEEQQKMEAEFRREFGGFGKQVLHRSERRAGEAALRQHSTKVASKSEALNRLTECLAALLAEVAFPCQIRRRLADWLTENTARTRAELQSFETAVLENVPLSGDLVGELTASQTSTDRTAVDGEMLDLLFGIAGGAVSAPSHVPSMLQFRPVPDRDKVSYKGCRTVADHFNAGAVTLSDRIGDYVEACAAPIRPMGLLEAISLKGQDEVWRALNNLRQRCRRFLDLAEDTFPKLRASGSLTEETVVWLGAQMEMIAPSCQAALGKATDVRQWDDRRRLQIAYWLFGLPCAALRVMMDEGAASETAQSNAG